MIETKVPLNSGGEISELYLHPQTLGRWHMKKSYRGTAAEKLPTPHPMKNRPTNYPHNQEPLAIEDRLNVPYKLHFEHQL